MLTIHESSESNSRSNETITKMRSDTIDLSDDRTLLVDISDALSEKEKVKFTVHTKTNLPGFDKPEFSVVRLHEEFIWLHDTLVQDEEYSGFIIPPPPPRPDFDASREKLQKLGEGEGTMTKEEFNKTKQELEAEYLATFKKTVAMHEVFLQRLAAHPKFKNDTNFRIFLGYNDDLSVRGKNKKERLVDLLSRYSKSADDLVLSNTQKDIDEFFEHQKVFLIEYHKHIKDCTSKSDRMTRSHKNVAGSYSRIATDLIGLSTVDSNKLEKYYAKNADCFEKARKSEERIASDEDLKLSDTLRYWMRETAAAKDLLYRRLRCLANYESANKNLDRARLRNKEVALAEDAQQKAGEKFESISKLAKQELQDFNSRRIIFFRKNFVDLVELELKHAKAQGQLYKNFITSLKEELSSND
ncbi:sorting nexin-6-like [Panonychus citri]|uniref:sorting nexin-6-like n=1 Tax=Panonychus citri TaxID=50023 RepID=UPI0023073789|nr:sorting nexin-6-like [Panonychus citri]